MSAAATGASMSPEVVVSADKTSVEVFKVRREFPCLLSYYHHLWIGVVVPDPCFAFDAPQGYVHAAVEALDTVRSLVTEFAVRHIFTHSLSKEELARYNEIVGRKKILIGELQVFAATVAAKLRVVGARINDEKFATLEECYAGFDRAETLEKAQALQADCASLEHEVATFSSELSSRHGAGAPEAKRICDLCVFAVATVACIAAIALHFIPGVAVIFSPAALALIATGGVVAFFGASARLLTRGQVERAQNFLQNLEEKLCALRSHLAHVRANTATLVHADRSECGPLLARVIEECDAIVSVCAEA